MFLDVSNKPSEFLPLLLSRLKDASFATKAPLFQHIFEDLLQSDQIRQLQEDGSEEDGHGAEDPDQARLRELTGRVNADASFALPPGFIKVRADKITEAHEPDPARHPGESEQIAVKVLDSLIADIFDFHILEPVIKHEKHFLVKPQQRRLPSPGRLPPAPARYASGAGQLKLGQGPRRGQRAASANLSPPKPKARKIQDRYIQPEGSREPSAHKPSRFGASMKTPQQQSSKKLAQKKNSVRDPDARLVDEFLDMKAKMMQQMKHQTQTEKAESHQVDSEADSQPLQQPLSRHDIMKRRQ